MRRSTWLPLFGFVVAGFVQDPVRARPPAGAGALQPVRADARTVVVRDDLIQQFLPPSPLEGFWELKDVVRGGVSATGRVRGYLAAGRQYLSIQVQEQPEVPGTPPWLQAGTRRYRIEGQQIVMTSLVGHDNHVGKKLRLDPVGLVETRQISMAGSMLRIHQGPASYMEFVRLE